MDIIVYVGRSASKKHFYGQNIQNWYDDIFHCYSVRVATKPETFRLGSDCSRSGYISQL